MDDLRLYKISGYGAIPRNFCTNGGAIGGYAISSNCWTWPHIQHVEVTGAYFKNIYKSMGVYRKIIFRLQLKVSRNYYHIKSNVLEVYNK